MRETKKTIGILGGTFDPIHIGHLRLALEMLEALNLAKVHFIPAYQTVHREQPIASVSDRLNMVNLAVEGESEFLVDIREIRRQGPSYMIDTLAELRREYTDTPICLLVGVDAFNGLDSWHKWQEIFDYAHIIIAHRPQYQLPKEGTLANILKQRLQKETAYIHNHLAGGILLQPITPLDISSTDVRKLIALGRNPRYLLPDKVFEYINHNGTYRQ